MDRENAATEMAIVTMVVVAVVMVKTVEAVVIDDGSHGDNCGGRCGGRLAVVVMFWFWCGYWYRLQQLCESSWRRH